MSASKNNLFICVSFYYLYFISAKVVAGKNTHLAVCSENSFHCVNGQCVAKNATCDKYLDCEDNSDEYQCYSNDFKPVCKLGFFQCLNGQCINQRQVCDGHRDCDDNSDEISSTCSSNRCPPNSFQCAYGGCINDEAVCDGVRDCEDYSDELIPGCQLKYLIQKKALCGKYQFRCKSGHCINATELCDGLRHCADGSDETVKECGHLGCTDSETFQCEYGACVNPLKVCDGLHDCADGSDEANCEVRSRIKRVPQEGDGGEFCILPKPPVNGYYVANEGPITPGTKVPKWRILLYSCNKNYRLDSENSLICLEPPKWNKAPPRCKKICPPLIEPSLDIVCTRNRNPVPCNETMLNGTIATVECKLSYEFRTSDLQPFHATVCRDGKWDHDLFKCEAVCGTVVPRGTPLVIKGVTAYKGEFPWQAAIYSKLSETFHSQICGGSIITPQLVLTAAHCFWNYESSEGGIHDASKYSVTAGKIFREWDHKDDKYAQYNDVQRIIVPERFRAEESSYSDDIAILVLPKSFRVTEIVHPICVDWKNLFYLEHFKKNAYGKVAGWGLTTEAGDPSDILQTVSLPFVEYNDCIRTLAAAFRRFITQDKICAGYTNGTSVCEGDSGGGLVFAKNDRYFIQGIVSLSATKGGSCDSKKYTAFTAVNNYVKWLQDIEVRYRQSSPEVGCGIGGNEVCKTDDGFDDADEVPGTCRGLKSSSLSFSCTAFSQEHSYRIWADCSKPATAGTKATFQCKPWYEDTSGPKDSETECDGSSWSTPLYSCVPVCGRKTPKSLASNDNVGFSTLGEFPWNSALFLKNDNNQYSQICGGTIIGPSLIITAAHCFPDGVSPSMLGVAAGAYYRTWQHPDDKLAQYRNVSQILITDTYKGQANNYDNDIAMVVLAEPLIISNVIRPVCIDWQDRYERLQIVPGAEGELAAWDAGKDGVLKAIKGPIAPFFECYSKANAQYKKFITRDKICIAFEEGEGACKEENIGGITFTRNGRHYLRGIPGVIPKNETERCASKGFTPFTRISRHLDWIRHNEIRNRPKD